MASTSIWMPKRYSTSEDFELWISRFESYCRAAKVTEGLKCDVLLATLDDDAVTVVNSLGLSEEVLKDYGQLTTAPKKHFAPTTSPFELRFHLRRRRQKDRETLDVYAEALAQQAVKAFPDLTEKARQEVVRDQFIKGLRDEHVQERLLQEAPETMENALKFARQLGAARAAQRSLKSLQPATTTVSSISEGADLQQAVRRSVQEALKDYFPMPPSIQNSDLTNQSVDADVRAVTSQHFNQTGASQTGNRYCGGRGGSNRPLTCWNCGEPGHIRARCPEPRRDRGNCTGCGGRGHTQQECPTWRRERDETSSTRATNATISSRVANYNDGIFIDLQVAGEKIKFLVDTGSSISMVHHSCWQNSLLLKKIPLQQTSLSAVTANGLSLQVTGTIEAGVGLGLESVAHKFYVASDIKSDGILGLDLLEQLGATVDVKGGYLYLGPAKLPLRHCQRDVEVARIVLKENTTISANHEVIFPAEIEFKGHPESIEGVMEPDVSFVQRTGLLVGRVSYFH